MSTTDEKTTEAAGFVGWLRAPCGRWEPVAQSPTEAGCWSKLAGLVDVDAEARDVLILPVGNQP